MTIVSKAEAARLTGKGRNTIGRHLDSGKLSGRRSEDGDWEIDISELIRVYGELKKAGGEEGWSTMIHWSRAEQEIRDPIVLLR